MKNNKILGAAIFLLVILFVMSCSEDPVSPTKEQPIEALAAAEIGSGGGKVESENVSIIVPPGAFTEKHNVAIYSNKDDGSFGENTASSSFRLSGIPNSYNQPIKIKLKYKGELSGQSFIAVGDKTTDIVNEDSSIVYNLLTASDSSGFLIGELSANTKANLLKSEAAEIGDPFDKVIHAVTAYNSLQTEHFILSYPISLASQASNVGTVMEDAYSIVLNDLGFSLNKDNERMLVTVAIQNKAVTGYFKLNLSRDLLSMSKYGDIKIGLGKKMLDLGIEYLLPYNFDKYSANFLVNYYWLKKAILTWSEGLFTDDPNFKYPTNFPANAMAPFNGMRAGAGGDYDKILFINHGYGMSSMIKYLVDDSRFGKAGIVKTYQDIFQDVNSITALINNIDAMVADWWPDFIKTYMNGEIYNIPKDYFLENTKLEWSINDENDTLKVFAASDPTVKFYPDLSAKLFKINLNYPDLDPSSGMLLSMKSPVFEEGLALVVFGVKNGELIYLETAHSQDFEIPDLKDYYDNNMRQFLVALVNSNFTSINYIGESDIDLEIKVTPKEQKVQFNRCTFSYTITHNVHYEYRTSEGVTSDADYSKLVHTFGFFEGSLQGNIFSGSFEEDDGLGNTVNQTVTVVLNSSQDTLTNFSITHTEVSTYSDNISNIFKSMSGANLRKTGNDGERIIFSVEGPNTCDYVITSDFTENVRYESGSAWTTQNSTTTSWGECDDYNRIDIYLWKE
ncbi:MAG: hypothetical protein GXO85_07305 [Chlorobi bacterium]|nr:hypothetical protein [Chlorobiota bacterium]